MKKHLTLFLIFWAFCAVLSADDSLSVNEFFDYQRDCVQEKLHLTLDRPYYEAGDTVWFRGTLVSADNLSYMLKTNYIVVELHDRDGQLVTRRKVARAGLCFHHCLPLGEDLPSGDYILSAYTSWMRNFDSDLFFSRRLHITNRFDNAASADATTSPKAFDFSVQFFPEGGQFLANVPDTQRIAFAAVGRDGYPVEVDGELLSDADAPLSDVRSLHDGMGAFAYAIGQRPSKVRFTLRDYADANGMQLTRTFDLPDGVADTLAVSLQVVGNQVKILGARHDSLRLIMHGGARLVSQSRVAAGQIVPLDMTTLRMGINHLVLADENGIGLSRRLLFRCDSLPSANPIAKISDTIENRSLVTMKLHLEDVAGHAAWGDFAVSITDGGFVSADAFRHDGDIVSNLLLTSDLKGYIHQPGWYFADGRVRREEIDLLMLTHGWCRFATDSMGYVPKAKVFEHPLEQNEWLSGEVYHLKKKELGKNMPITVYDPTGVSLGMGKIDSLGRFFIGYLHYPDEAPLEIRVLSKTSKPYYKFDEPTFPDFSVRWPMSAQRRTWRSVADSASSDINLLHGEQVKMLDKVEVKAQRRDTADYTGGKLLFRGSNNASELAKKYDLNVQNTAYDVVVRCIRDEWWKNWDFDPSYDYTDRKHALGARISVLENGRNALWRPSMKADEVLLRIPSDKVDSISVVVSTGKIRLLPSRRGIFGTEKMYEPDYWRTMREIRIFLRPGFEFSDKIPDCRRRTYQTFGYTMPVEFYHPIYETEFQRKNPEPDFRKTLQWLPSVQTDRDGNVEIRYYESDHTSSPRHLVIEGVTFTGRPVHLESTIETTK